MLRRREFIASAIAAAIIDIPGASAAEEALRVFWWGNPDRAKRTGAVIKQFETSAPGVKFVGQVATSDYWVKLSTMVAGRNVPDVFALEPVTFADYSRRGATLDMTQFQDSIISSHDFAPGALDLGTVDGKLTGVPTSLNAAALIIDKTALEKAGVAAPTATTTWAQFKTICTDFRKSVGTQNIFAVGNGARYSFVFEVWLRQRGKTLFTQDGHLGFEEADAAEWFDYWDQLAKAGGCVTADIQALDKGNIETNPVASGNAVMAFAYSNQLAGYGNLAKSEMSIGALPTHEAAGPSGLFYRPSTLWSISPWSKSPETAAKFINFFVNDPNAGHALGTERGVPVNMKIQGDVAATGDKVSKQTIEYIMSLKERVGPYPPAIPIGAAEFSQQVLTATADSLAFEQISPSEAAKQLMAEGKRIFGG
ncbi:extracellular solute-binding protein [Rhizobium cauense]|uniref:ABC transporter substrate-binding protein n=1 Tax=Rhizobium cauense TaxID=1166683 RepID=UPI001C6E3CF6|nr:extracellular solute-binding protein [Rhizobium cauense]MBW9114005.1 extracellular solute-binding protein [Rhizobium cauense]